METNKTILEKINTQRCSVTIIYTLRPTILVKMLALKRSLKFRHIVVGNILRLFKKSNKYVIENEKSVTYPS
jgi:hypothetical protein